MTNDTNTLNGALQELGETMADNLTTMGVPSTYDEGLTSLAQKILSIGPTPPTPTPASISLTGTKSILSYADSESSVLTATVLDDNDDPVEGVSVELYKDSVLWDTLTTGSAGTVSKTYTSAGVGDVSFTAECGSLVTETYDIVDAWKYISSTYTGNQDFDISMPTGDFEVSFKVKPTSRTTSWANVHIGTSATNRVLVGQVGASGVIGLYGNKNSSSYTFTKTTTNTAPLNTDTTVTYQYVNGVHTVKALNETLTQSESGIPLTKLYHSDISNNSIKEILIKPL